MRVSDDARKSVVFFGIDGEGVDVVDYGGTGFLCADMGEGIAIPLLVTCRHVAQLLSGHEQFYVRANTRGGESYTLPVSKMDWRYHPDSTVDLASVVLVLPNHTFDVIYYRFDPEFVILGDSGRKQLMCGDVINLIGLFRLHAGKQRNIPFVHTGHLAVLSDSSERIPVRNRTTNKVVPAEVHLVEAQTLDGLSGSPVFAHEMVSLGNFVIGREPDQHPYAFGKVRLLGIYSGSWDGEPGEILASDKNLRGNVRVPVGVGTVVPADKLMELVRDHPQMKEDRKTLMQAILAERSASR
jgi:hypothetical protein